MDVAAHDAALAGQAAGAEPADQASARRQPTRLQALQAVQQQPSSWRLQLAPHIRSRRCVAPTAERGGKTGSAAAGIGAAASGGGGSSSLWQPHSSISNLHVSPAQIAVPIRGRQEDSEQGLAALAAATEAFADRGGKALKGCNLCDAGAGRAAVLCPSTLMRRLRQTLQRSLGAAANCSSR